MRYEGFIWDFDGVLLDSAFDDWQWAAETRKRKAKELGYDYRGEGGGFLFQADTLDEMKQLVESNGFSWQDYIRVEKAVAEKKARMVENGEMQLFPGAREVLQELDVPMAVVSNAFGESVDDIVLELGLDEHLEFWT
ncbi:MAG: HAD family hydrolase, partial [Candidatus Nanohaloarchaea archaeon]